MKLDLEDLPVLPGTHWHTLSLNNLDQNEINFGVTEARPTLREARELLAEMYTTPAPGEEDGPEETPEEREMFIAGVRAGALDLVDEDTFVSAVFPCTADGEDACRQTGERMAGRILRLRAISSGTCPCPKHTAAREAAKHDDKPLTGMYL